MVKYGKTELELLVSQLAKQTRIGFGLSYYSGRYSVFNINTENPNTIDIANDEHSNSLTGYQNPLVIYHILKSLIKFSELIGVVYNE
jgi:hypothetical protein